GCLLAASCESGPAPGSAPDLAITSVNVVDVVSGEVLPDRTVTVRGGRITGVVPAAEAARARDAGRVLDGTGRYLIPGLWDAHVHFRGGADLIEENRALLPLYVANGVTTVRDAGGDITEAILAWRQAIAAGRMTGPRILTSGPKLDGPRPAWEGSIALSTPADVPAALDSLEALGADYVKIYDGSTPADVYLAIVEEAERRDMIVTGHMPFSVRFMDAVEAGLDATEHLYYAYKGASPLEDSVTAAVGSGDMGFWDALYLMMDGPHDPGRERATWRSMVEHGTVVVPTLHIGEVLARVDEDDHQDDPELRYVDPAVEETWAGRVRSARRASPESRRRTRALRDTLAATVSRMGDAGVTILAGSDAGPFNSYVYPGFSLHSEMEALVEAGLTPAEALRAATVAPAERWREGDALGRVAEGYLADLVLLEENPLEDIANARSIAVVILRGRDVLDAMELQAMLEEVER
ncbi:MAG TPA: amidohydrolase family protein, partial [Longimicrobiales bacterium]|nr:amidohydrolase family protein [Longimicrobiales bacterium]